MITCDSISQNKRKQIRCLGRIENVHGSPHAAHRTLLRNLPTDLANASTRCGIIGNIYALLHHSLGGLADLEQRGGIAILVFTFGHEVDDTFTIIYGLVNDAWSDFIFASHSGPTAAPSKRKRFIVIHAFASWTPHLAFVRRGNISKGIEAAVSVEVVSEMGTFAFWSKTGGHGEVCRRR